MGDEHSDTAGATNSNVVKIPDVSKNPEADYYEALDALREQSAAPLIDSGGVTARTFLRAADIRAILTDHEHFTSTPLSGSRGYMQDVLIPSGLDPPEHTKFRMLLQPLFTPAVARSLGSSMRTLAKELIGGVVDRGHCEFIEEFAAQYAGGVFCQVVGLPLSDLPYILKWEREVWLPRAEDPDRSRQAAGLQALKDYLVGKVEQVRKSPDESMLATLLAAEIDGRPLTDHEIKMIGLLLCLGGIHTTKAALGKMLAYLGRDDALQQDLREDGSKLPSFVEEFLRLNSLGHSYRHVKADAEVGGCPLRRGEMIALHWGAGSRDPREFENPTELMLERSPNRHLAFGYGPHMCLGMHVARLDMTIALEEWLVTIGPFRLLEADAVEEQTLSGVGVKALRLVWQ